VLAQRAICEAYLLAENPAEALYHAEQGYRVAVAMRMRLSQAQFGVLKAAALLALDRLAEASADAGQAAALCEELEARPILLECRLLMARLALRNGAAEEARAHCQAAVDLARDYRIPLPEWRFQSVVAQALASESRIAEAVDTFREALRGLDAERRRLVEATGEDRALEEPLARQLWQQWLEFLAAAEGADRAQSAAVEADWPPLLDWLAGHGLPGGGQPNA
jgi:tetratricopeptide (TPR) repeat protein